MRRTLQERFEAWIDKETSKKGCWLWAGCKDKDGYGMIGDNGKTQRAHRVSWQLHNPTQPIPDGWCVLHKCDTPPCINPEHLKLGTNQDNVQDRVRRGRSAKGLKNGTHTHPERRARGQRNGSHTHPECRARFRGESHYSSKLTEAGVIAIYHAKGTLKQIAENYGVSHQHVSRIKNGKVWRHINTEVE